MLTQWGPVLKRTTEISYPAANDCPVTGETVPHEKETEGALKAGPKRSCRGDGKVG